MNDQKDFTENTPALHASALQDQYAPDSICFGCGPKNQKGLRIKSRLSNELSVTGQPIIVADFKPDPHHEAFPGMLNGGIIGALLDCHSNWTAAVTLMQAQKINEPPCTVTADFHVKLRAPTSSHQGVRLRAWAVNVATDRALIQAQLFTVSVEGRETLTATCTGTFVQVKPGHPAYHRWGVGTSGVDT